MFVRRCRARAAVPSLAVIAAAMSLFITAPSAEACADCATWSARSDGGLLADDVARFVAVSPTAFNNPETVFVTGSAAKPGVTSAAGVSDLDVLTSAYDAATGTPIWSTRFDDDLSTDAVAGMEVNYNNNLVYVPVNAGNDVVTAEYNIRNGDEVSQWRHPNAKANDSAISSAGGFMGIAGTAGGKFLVLSYQTGQGILDINAMPTDGEAFGADISHAGSLDTSRTLLVTGKKHGFGTGGDLYTVAYNYRTFAKLWERSWASATNSVDEGRVAESAHVTSLGKGVGFIAGRTFNAPQGFDVFVGAYDLATGAPIWTGDGGLRFFDAAGGDDSPVALVYSDKTSTLYLSGTSKRGFPNGTDAVTVAFDAVTGARKRVAFAGGDVSNGDDKPTGLTVSGDGNRVFVALDAANNSVNGGLDSKIVAYDADLHPAGSRIVRSGGSFTDRSAGVALSRDGASAFLASSVQGASTYDFGVDAFATPAFAVLPVATRLTFTAASAIAGDYTDTVPVEARLSEATGEPLASRNVRLSLGADTVEAVTDANGIARASFTLDEAPGNYSLAASFAGAAPFSATSASRTFELRKEQPALTLVVSGSGPKRVLTATLRDADAPGAAVVGRRITFVADGSAIGSAVTNTDGVATLTVPPRYRSAGLHRFDANFAGDAYFLAVTASITTL